MATNLYQSRFFGPLLRNPLYQRATQWGLVVALGLLIAAAWGRDRLPGIADPYPLLYTHATTLVLWVVWFMGLVLTAPLLGRLWCGVCPLGFLSDRLGRVGLNLPWPNGPARWLGLFLIFFAGVGAALFWDAHKSPHATALLVAAATALALVTGLLWRRSGFCRLLCPVGLVLGLYARFSPLSITPADPALCDGCADRSCTDRKGVWKRWELGNLVFHKKVYRSGCPVALHPPTMNRSECLLCLQCVRSCSNENLAVTYGQRCSTLPLTSRGSAMLFFLAGLVTLALIRTWPALRDGLTPGAVAGGGWAWAVWLGLALPFLLFFSAPLLAWLGQRAAGREVTEPTLEETGEESWADAPVFLAEDAPESFAALAGRLLPPFLGPLLGAHAALALVKLNAKVTYLPYLFYDPLGASTYLAIHVANTLPLPEMVLPLSLLRWLALGCLGLGTLIGLREAVHSWRGRFSPFIRLVAIAGFAAFTMLMGATLVHWLFPLLGGRG